MSDINENTFLLLAEGVLMRIPMGGVGQDRDTVCNVVCIGVCNVCTVYWCTFLRITRQILVNPQRVSRLVSTNQTSGNTRKFMSRKSSCVIACGNVHTSTMNQTRFICTYDYGSLQNSTSPQGKFYNR
jgi:hypothetical protein